MREEPGNFFHPRKEEERLGRFRRRRDLGGGRGGGLRGLRCAHAASKGERGQKKEKAGAHPSTRRTVSLFGPWAPRTRMRSMSPVRLGPVINDKKAGTSP